MNFFRSTYPRARASDLFRHGALVLSATTFANFCGFAFHALASRELGVARYGGLYALLSVATIASLPAGICMTVVSKLAAGFHALGDSTHLHSLVRLIWKIFGSTALLYALGGVIFSRELARFLHVPAWGVVIALTIAALTILGTVLRAVAQGTQDFEGFSWSYAVDGGAKVLFFPLSAMLKLGLADGLLAFLAGVSAAGLLIALRLRATYISIAIAELKIDWKNVLTTTIGASALTISVAILGYGDVIVVKHFFSPSQAGIYSAASLGGKILSFLASFGPLVLIPKAVERDSRGENALAALIVILLIIVALSTAVLAAFFVEAPAILHLLLGGSFSAAAALLPWYGVAMFLLALTTVIASYSIALHRFAFALPLILIALAEIVAIGFYHPTLYRVVMVLIGGNSLGLLAVSALTLKTGKKQHNAARGDVA